MLDWCCLALLGSGFAWRDPFSRQDPFWFGSGFSLVWQCFVGWFGSVSLWPFALFCLCLLDRLLLLWLGCCLLYICFVGAFGLALLVGLACLLVFLVGLACFWRLACFGRFCFWLVVGLCCLLVRMCWVAILYFRMFVGLVVDWFCVLCYA